MIKYFARAAYDDAPIGSLGCGDLAPSGGWINDQNGHGCWAVDGPRIPIEKDWTSLHAACEIINAAFNAVSEQPGLSNIVYLNGSFEISRG